MPGTARYNQLVRRISKIEKNYLPVINPTGNYSLKEYDDLRAYLLLIHAEIEAYFEDISEEKAKKSFNEWETNRTKSSVLLALVTFSDSTITGYDLEKKVKNVLSTYIRKLKNNHGIKDKNLLEILLPLGIEHDEIDPAFLNTMSAFGSSRGAVAHSTASVQTPLDPQTLKNTVSLIVGEIRLLDDKIRKIR